MGRAAGGLALLAVASVLVSPAPVRAAGSAGDAEPAAIAVLIGHGAAAHRAALEELVARHGRLVSPPAAPGPLSGQDAAEAAGAAEVARLRDQARQAAAAIRKL